jgi:hypothetical protein
MNILLPSSGLNSKPNKWPSRDRGAGKLLLPSYLAYYFYSMHPVVYLLYNIYLSIGQPTQQLL